MKYSTLDEAIDMQNGVPQGLSSSIFTVNLKAAEGSSPAGSDCGIANVNTAPPVRKSAAPSVAKGHRRRA